MTQNQAGCLRQRILSSMERQQIICYLICLYWIFITRPGERFFEIDVLALGALPSLTGRRLALLLCFHQHKILVSLKGYTVLVCLFLISRFSLLSHMIDCILHNCQWYIDWERHWTDRTAFAFVVMAGCTLSLHLKFSKCGASY